MISKLIQLAEESKFDEIACELGVDCSDLWEDFENYHSAKYGL